ARSPRAGPPGGPGAGSSSAPGSRPRCRRARRLDGRCLAPRGFQEVMLDLRLVNANVVTMDPARPVAREIGIWHGRIFDLDEDLPAAEVIDLQGATVLPGFIDAHVHLAWTGLEEGGFSVAG